MPFISQSALDSFILAGDNPYNISLHTEQVPTIGNELHAGNAPGYFHQAKSIGNTLAFPATVFGPAVGHWPEVRSIGIGVHNPLAYHPLPPDARFSLRSGDRYTIPSSYLGVTLRRATGDLGWLVSNSGFRTVLRRLYNSPRIAGGADLDPNGARANPVAETPDYIDLGNTISVYQAAINLYEANPLHTPQGLREPLRSLKTLRPILFGFDFDLPSRRPEQVLPFYWSPLFHALTSYLPFITDIGRPGTATHWVLSSSPDFPVDLSSVLFVGEIQPNIVIAENEVLGFAQRSIRIRMTV